MHAPPLWVCDRRRTNKQNKEEKETWVTRYEQNLDQKTRAEHNNKILYKSKSKEDMLDCSQLTADGFKLNPASIPGHAREKITSNRERHRRACHNEPHHLQQQ